MLQDQGWTASLRRFHLVQVGHLTYGLMWLHQCQNDWSIMKKHNGLDMISIISMGHCNVYEVSQSVMWSTWDVEPVILLSCAALTTVLDCAYPALPGCANLCLWMSVGRAVVLSPLKETQDVKKLRNPLWVWIVSTYSLTHSCLRTNTPRKSLEHLEHLLF